MRIVHAVCDEGGNARGGRRGDQTGREIRETEWYARDGGWAQYVECADPEMARRAAAVARAIAAGNYGYSQDAEGRWSGYDSIREKGVEAGAGDFDCSSLVLSCYRLAGAAVKERRGSTRDIAKRLCDTGGFRLYTDAAHTGSPALAKEGSLYCTPGRHVVICVGGGEKSAPAGAEAGGRLRVRGSVRIREKPVDGRTVAIARAGQVLTVTGRDAETGWYRVAEGYVTDGGRYVEHV